jgi:hypothetical protein
MAIVKITRFILKSPFINLDYETNKASNVPIMKPADITTEFITQALASRINYLN